MSLFNWTENMSVGSSIIDSDHRALIDLINKVGDIASGKGNEEIGEVLDGLIAYVEYHFAREEKMMTAAGYADVETHKSEHAGFSDHVYQLRRSFDLDSTAIDSHALAEYLKNWLNHHIMIQDMGYKPQLEGNKVAETVGLEFGAGLAEREL
ncbi:MAG: hemerythrin family protein [Alphaproteobacteria bacterium]|jgi:hemerythrin|nr:hemerythrin family protein [Alphaproteobacteria bacterium]